MEQNKGIEIDGRHFPSTINAVSPEFKGSNEVMSVCKEVLLQIALNNSGYQIALVTTPYKLESEPDAIGILLQLQVASEVLAPIHRMVGIEKMTNSFKTRSVSIKQENAASPTVEVTYLLTNGNEDPYDDQVIYAIDDELHGKYRQIELADRDIFEFLMTGKLKGEDFGPDAE